MHLFDKHPPVTVPVTVGVGLVRTNDGALYPAETQDVFASGNHGNTLKSPSICPA